MEPASTRERVLRTVRLVPGLATRDVARRAGVDESTADYHLRRLLRAGAILSARTGRSRVWYAANAGYCPVLRVATPPFRRAEVRRVALALDARPQSASRIALRTGLRVGAVRWALGTLRAVGLAGATPSGRVVLRPGADVCVARASCASGCTLWGRCVVSRSMLGPTSSR